MHRNVGDENGTSLLGKQLILYTKGHFKRIDYKKI